MSSLYVNSFGPYFCSILRTELNTAVLNSLLNLISGLPKGWFLLSVLLLTVGSFSSLFAHLEIVIEDSIL